MPTEQGTPHLHPRSATPRWGTRLMRWLPLRMDRYVFWEVFSPFLGGLVFIIFVLMMSQALRLSDFFIVHGVSGQLLGKMAGLMAVSFVPIALPIAFLIAILVGFGRLSADSELVAMKASGLSLNRLSMPPLVLAIVVSGLSLGLNLQWAPWSEKEFKDTLIRISNTRALSALKQGAFNTDFFDLLIFADKVDNKTDRLYRVFIYDEREPKSPQTIVAQSGEILQVRKKSQLGATIILKLYDGSIHSSNSEEKNYSKIDFGEYSLYLNIDEGGGNNSMKPRMYAYHELLEWIAQTRPEAFDGRESRGEYWRRIASALSPIIFVFLGIGLGTFRTRAVKAGATLMGLIVFLAYYGSQTVAGMWMQKGIFPPYVAMQLPNLFMALIGVVSFRKASW